MSSIAPCIVHGPTGRHGADQPAVNHPASELPVTEDQEKIGQEGAGGQRAARLSVNLRSAVGHGVKVHVTTGVGTEMELDVQRKA
jgi:hypothetical protein